MAARARSSMDRARGFTGWQNSLWGLRDMSSDYVAIFVPHISRQKPLVVVEVDGHDYHERTSGQASSDNRRDRALQRLGISVFRFTATDVLRNSAHAAREIAGFVHDKLHENAARATELAELEAAAWDDGYQYGFLLS
jgi:hypothetical protein